MDHSVKRTAGANLPRRQGCVSAPDGSAARLRELVDAPADEVAAAAREAVSPSSETVSVHLVVARAAERTVSVRALTRPHFGLGGSIV